MARRKKGRDIHGILLLDKRQGISSNKALQEVKRLYDANKAGHTGSLDPLATGLLPVCLGEATKVSAFMLADDKRYQTVIQLGVMTDTGDVDGTVLEVKEVPEISEQQLASCLTSFVGQIEQIPPMYSALKHNGKKLYELAREGITVERKARKITIYGIECLSFVDGLLTLDVQCSKGTYIRTLAEDIGHALNCGGTVKELRRTAAGMFKLENALTIEQLKSIESDDALQALLIAVDKPLQAIPAINISQLDADLVLQGQQISVPDEKIEQGLRRLYHEQKFLGLGEMLLNAKIQPRKLFKLN
ncbi:tRNA pseudouridine(55) synthase TruB [Methylococcaceae bacterium HT4]|nr:tRNA pseudouridine(55) synthase TruB [Methyloprofundus sp.]TXK94578.1 tRNA pseudouridine(55) synthase TruB [Methylococcaceae bacterium CS4]TXK99102.1 tRNA pseudouridine(55) synthase TruB [Methylococcaceae bacterium CS5]TXL04064.1 tRNA pseudouridine(55) synthase TruB [Methylococcaceae bacterium CS1]TXL06664.1 tRNA pseudouridine(55) synthase TruB [Methylococcaceae bacterium CS3]TXL10796.1 tRNA pseudouridine(55) synthase TruB [Methylococcaceae bacterium CS2]TXL13179.1 tRNA pseudouridine(55) s